MSTDNRFRSICKSIAKKPYLADDLYQEFFLSLCEIKDNRLIEAHNGGYLEVLCVGIINNIWGKRYRVKKRYRGDTHPLYECGDTHYSIDVVRALQIDDDEFDEVKEQERDKALDLMYKSMDSDDQTERFNSRVFFYSRAKYRSPLQFHKESGIPVRACYSAYNNYMDQLRKQLCI